MIEKGKVGILVVTFNRLNDLKICISSIKNQTYKNYDIVIVNNGSTDGTLEYLNSVEGITPIHQENVGGAGGFYTGMKYVYEHGYDWLLMLDDDGVMSETELENLLFSYDEIKAQEGKDMILNALVVNKEKRDEISFLWARGSSRSKLVSELQQEKYFNDIHPFNGTLVKRSIIEKIGFIKKEMFIWGDEEEYMARARHNGFGTCTVTNAIHYHPKEKGVRGYLIPFCKKYFIVVKPVKFSHNFYRNRGFIYGHYPERKGNIFPFMSANIFYNITHLRFRECWKFIKYFRRGLHNNYN